MRFLFIVMMLLTICPASAQTLQGEVNKVELVPMQPQLGLVDRDQFDRNSCVVNLQPQAAKNSNVPSAVGLYWDTNTGIVKYVDPRSDLYGRVKLGWRIISVNGCNPLSVAQSRGSIGDAGTTMILRFQTPQGTFDFSCVRHPITWFSPWVQHQLGY